MIQTIKDRIAKINNGQVPEGYEKTSFGIFPCDWEKDKEFGELFDFYGGLGKSREELGDKGVCYLHYGDMHTNTFNKVTYEQYSHLPKYDIALKGNETYLMQDGDIAFLDASEDLGGTSRAVLIDNVDNKPFIAGLHTILAKEKQSVFSKYYKQYITLSQDVKKQFQKLAVGFKVYGLNRESIKKIKISYPKTEQEQSRIAQILMQWDKTIELQEKLIKSYQKLKKYYLSKMFPKKGSLYPEIRFAGFTEPWEMRNLGDIGTTYGGLTGKTKEDFGHGDAKFVTYMNVFTNPIGKPDMTESVEYDSSQNEVKKGDVLFTTSSETPEEVGMSCVWMEDLPNTYLNSFCFGYRPIMDFDLHYLAYVLRSDSIRQKIILLAQGISRYNISKSKVMQLNIPIPTKEEQRLLGAFFENIDNLISCYQNNLDKLIAQRKALMQVLLTGIVRV